MLQTLLAFLLTIGVLIAVHEYGHYKVARLCGVRVLRFSIGMGKVLWRRQPDAQGTEFVIGAFPIGGYVKMLDEREGPVDASLRHQAFNTQPLRVRAAIVAAGPLANLLLAVLVYAAVAWMGVQEPRAILATPMPGSLAQLAGVQGGESVQATALADEPLQALRSFEELRWRLIQAALNGQDIRLALDASEDGGARRTLTLPLAQLQGSDEVQSADAALLRKIGITAPWTAPVLGDLTPGGAGERAGLLKGDRVLALGDTLVADGRQLRDAIRASVQGDQPWAQDWRLQRGAQTLSVRVVPEVRAEGPAWVGRIGAYVGAPPAMTLVRYGPLDGLWHGMQHTWEVCALTLRMMGKMLLGQAPLKNLSGPLTIADYAGKSASIGLAAFLSFLALVSVSLGVLNLLPLPVLDGGHLMYYLWEGVTGRTVSEAWMERLQRSGIALLLVMMSIAVFNDVTRLFG